MKRSLAWGRLSPKLRGDERRCLFGFVAVRAGGVSEAKTAAEGHFLFRGGIIVAVTQRSVLLAHMGCVPSFLIFEAFLTAGGWTLRLDFDNDGASRAAPNTVVGQGAGVGAALENVISIHHMMIPI